MNPKFLTLKPLPQEQSQCTDLASTYSSMGGVHCSQGRHATLNPNSYTPNPKP